MHNKSIRVIRWDGITVGQPQVSIQDLMGAREREPWFAPLSTFLEGVLYQQINQSVNQSVNQSIN